MINFRYHVVSLVAVFMALALGMIMGSTVISDVTIDRLEADARAFRKSNSELREQADRLEAKITQYERFGDGLMPDLIRGRLAGRPVLLVVQDGAPGELLDGISAVVQQAGARKPSRLRLTADWALQDESDRERLAEIAGVAATDEPREIVARAALALGTRLASSSDPKAAADSLRPLEAAGFVRLEDLAAGVFPAAGSLLVVVVSGAADGADAEALFVSLLRPLAGKRTLALAEAFGADESVTDRIRGDRDLAAVVATVDHGDTAPGRLSLVWALRTLLDGKPAPHYGVHRGTAGVAPHLDL